MKFNKLVKSLYANGVNIFLKEYDWVCIYDKNIIYKCRNDTELGDLYYGLEYHIISLYQRQFMKKGYKKYKAGLKAINKFNKINKRIL